LEEEGDGGEDCVPRSNENINFEESVLNDDDLLGPRAGSSSSWGDVKEGLE
jgi:hypothetical protein